MLYDAPTLSKLLCDHATWARVVDILDGDTVIVVFEFLGTPLKWNVRLNGIDTCELKSKDADAQDLATLAQKRLFQLLVARANTDDVDACKSMMPTNRQAVRSYLQCNQTIVFMTCRGIDKYGRLLADLYAQTSSREEGGAYASISINATLIAEGLAGPTTAWARKHKVNHVLQGFKDTWGYVLYITPVSKSFSFRTPT